jgi:hypothetical protein
MDRSQKPRDIPPKSPSSRQGEEDRLLQLRASAERSAQWHRDSTDIDKVKLGQLVTEYYPHLRKTTDPKELEQRANFYLATVDTAEFINSEEYKQLKGSGAVSKNCDNDDDNMDAQIVSELMKAASKAGQIASEVEQLVSEARRKRKEIQSPNPDIKGKGKASMGDQLQASREEAGPSQHAGDYTDFSAMLREGMLPFDLEESTNYPYNLPRPKETLFQQHKQQQDIGPEVSFVEQNKKNAILEKLRGESIKSKIPKAVVAIRRVAGDQRNFGKHAIADELESWAEAIRDLRNSNKGVFTDNLRGKLEEVQDGFERHFENCKGRTAVRELSEILKSGSGLDGKDGPSSVDQGYRNAQMLNNLNVFGTQGYQHTTETATGPSMLRDTGTGASSSQDAGNTRDQIAIDNKSEAELLKRAQMALCPQIRSESRLTKEESNSRSNFFFARDAAKYKLERLNTGSNIKEVNDENTQYQATITYQNIIQVVDFALEGKFDNGLKASMRRLSNYEEPSNKSIKYVINKIKDPQVKEYWNPQSNQAEHS